MTNSRDYQLPILRPTLRRSLCSLLCAVWLSMLLPIPAYSQGIPRTSRTPAQIPTGPAQLMGELHYTLPDFFSVYPDPYITLLNVSPYIDMPVADHDFLLRDSQVLGQITSDYESPLRYRLLLPVEPLGPSVDVDQDRERDAGVQIYTVELMSNVVGDPYLDLGWGDSLSEYGSALWSSNGDRITGGKLVVYAPDDAQQFPAAYGDDGLLFTRDDPMVTLDPGYSIVDLDVHPFDIDRGREPQVDLLEPADLALNDLSHLDYAEAFDALIDLLAREYAFTDYYAIDWDALQDELATEVAHATAADDYDAFVTALFSLVNTIPDGHISVSVEELPESLLEAYSGSVGLVLQELDDGRVFVTESVEWLPAERAGIERGAEIFAVDHLPIREAISNTVPFSESGFPSPHYLRLQQAIYVERGPVDSTVRITYRNPGSPQRTTARLTRVESWDTIYQPRFYDPEIAAVPLPLEFTILDSGYGYLQLNRFWDDPVLTIDLWERAIDTLRRNEIDGLILDMRYNDGGFIWLAELLSAYLLHEEVAVGNVGYYEPERDEFAFDPFSHTIVPMPPDWRYDGHIALLIGPDCASACEFFSYALSLANHVEVMGYYPTLGMGGFVESVVLPDDILFYMTTGRAVDTDGEIHIEGVGIAPRVPTPVTKETIFSEYDVLIANAELHLKLHARR